jgi:hypothetical protein
MSTVEIRPPHGAGVVTVDKARVEKLVAAGWKPAETKPVKKPTTKK